MSQKNVITPISIFSDLLDGYSVARIADQVGHSNRSMALVIAQKGIDAMRSSNPTPQQQKDAHIALDYIFGADNSGDLVNNHGIDWDDADAYMKVIKSDYKIDDTQSA